MGEEHYDSDRTPGLSDGTPRGLLTTRCPYCTARVNLGEWHSCLKYRSTLMFRE